jgi:hypothetical protein
MKKITRILFYSLIITMYNLIMLKYDKEYNNDDLIKYDKNLEIK